MRKEKIQAKKKALRGEMMKKKGVSGLAIGHNAKGEEVLNIFVKSKKEAGALPKSYELEDGSEVAVEIVEVGDVKFTGFLGKYRPAQPGAVISHPNAPYDGTFGAVVTDMVSGKKVILGASHVLANFNTAAIGDAIVQPSTQQGGTVVRDSIGTLLRYVTLGLNAGDVNRADAAIVMPTTSKSIRERSFCSPIQATRQGAIGLVYAASSAITVINPTQFVEDELKVSFPKKATAAVGMSIHMCGAYSGYQVTQVAYMNADIWVNYNGNQIMWEDQIVAPAVGTAGDSGSVFYTTFNV